MAVGFDIESAKKRVRNCVLQSLTVLCVRLTPVLQSPMESFFKETLYNQIKKYIKDQILNVIHVTTWGRFKWENEENFICKFL